MSKAELEKNFIVNQEQDSTISEIGNRVSQLEKDLKSGQNEILAGIKILIDLLSD